MWVYKPECMIYWAHLHLYALYTLSTKHRNFRENQQDERAIKNPQTAMIDDNRDNAL